MTSAADDLPLSEQANEGEGPSSGFDINELGAIVDSLPDDGWVVDEIISTSPFETTQIVHRSKGLTGSRFIRKLFSRDSGLGAAYQKLLAKQSAGSRFEHLPIVYDVVAVGETIAVVTELVQGETLKHYVDTRGSSVETAVRVGLELCDAMNELHAGLDEPIVHRDLKPTNIMIAEGHVILIDLGISRQWRADGTRDTVRLGTPGYAPPEQFGYDQTTPQSDIYAAGMVLAFCLTGEDPPASLRSSNFCDPRIPPSFRAVLTCATALDPSARFANANVMKTAIRHIDASNAQFTSGPAGTSFAAGHSPAPPQHVAGSATVTHQRPVSADNVRPAASAPDQNTIGSPLESQSRIAGSALPKGPSGISNKLGIAWNALLALAWLFLTGICMYVSATGGTEFLDRLPIWVRFFDYLGLIVVPSGLAALVLADKRRLRSRFPQFARWSTKRLVAILVVGTFLLYVVITIFNMVFFRI